MRIEIRCIGKLNSKEIDSLNREFIKRLDFKLDFIEKVPSKKKSINEIKQDEYSKLLDKIPSNAILIALDENGKEYSSNEFASFVKKMITHGNSTIIFFIGGAFGLDQELLDKCDYKLSLSKMTLPHKLVRLFITEQIYRADSIIKGHPYHKN